MVWAAARSDRECAYPCRRRESRPSSVAPFRHSDWRGGRDAKIAVLVRQVRTVIRIALPGRTPAFLEREQFRFEDAFFRRGFVMVKPGIGHVDDAITLF